MADRNRRNKFIFTVGSTILKSMERVVDIIEEEDDEEVVESESSVRKTRTQIVRERIPANDRLMSHYFNEDCLYNDRIFRRRFRMHRPMFLRIVNDIASISSFIPQGADARQIEGFTPIQKCAVAVRQLAYGSVSDSWDEYFQMSERVVRESLEEFCECIISLYKKRYLRSPTESDIKALYAHHAEVHGFPGMLGSLDCMHWEWKYCPVAYACQYTKGQNNPTIVLEAVASQDLWVWHAFFGAPGSLNDLNILGRSPIFNKICNGSAADSSFTLRDRVYEHGYYLVDGIYTEMAVFAKPLKFPGDAKRDRYAKFQVRARKDIERTFGVLKSRWKILDTPARPRVKKRVENIMYACIILHNMVLEDEGKAICTYVESENNREPLYEPGSVPYNNIRRALRDNDVHHYLRNDLAEHLWTFNSVNPIIPVDVNPPPDATFSD